MMLSVSKREVIQTLAAFDMNISETARALGCSRNNVVQHVDRIQDITGFDPRCFYDLVELLKVVDD